MAKRKLEDLVSEQEAPVPTEELGGLIRSVGVGLRTGEVEYIDNLAASLGVSRNALMAWIIRRAIKELQAGTLVPPVEEETTRKLGPP